MQQVGLFLITLQLGLALLRPVHFHSFSLINSRFDRMRTKLFTSLQDSMNTDTLLKSIKDGPIPVSEREYIINGWRWHTESVIRDLNRFLDVIKSLEFVINENNIGSDTTGLNKAVPVKRLLESYNYVCNFNMKALIKVEREIFFPWLQDLLPRSAGALMKAILDEHIALNKASASIGSICNSLERITSSPVMTASNKKEILSNINRISELVNDLLTSSTRIQKCQEAVFVPYIAAYVKKGDQERFNRQVIAKLGLLDAQVHIVGMYEAIKNKPNEIKLFKAQIPKIAQAMIPVWKKRLYNPKTVCLSDKEEVAV